ncbi:YcfL family protein [Shewanella vesiculosa]|uniref:YcfL family protein n=1 Tax=Shewanella vesiculosa TaxID=518738 RepID=UPI0038504D96
MKTSLLCLIASALLLSACAHNTAGISANSSGQLRVDNTSFARDVNVTDVSSLMVADLIKASALIQSQSSTDLRIQYKFTWFDASGFTVEDEASSWKSVKLHGKQQLQVVAVAPNSQVTRFEVYVRQAFSN